MLKEFKDFINKGNVVTIAVGLVMALYFQKIVDAVLNGVINPLIGALFGEGNFSNIGFNIGDEPTPEEQLALGRSKEVSLGLVLDAAISFVAVAFFLFLVIKAYNKYAAKPEDEVTGDTELSLLTEIRDSLANR